MTTLFTRQCTRLTPSLATHSALLQTRLASNFASRTPSSGAAPAAAPSTPSISSLLAPAASSTRQPAPFTLSWYIKSTRNNTIMSLVGPSPQNGQIGTLFNISGGLAGFKKVHRSGYEAGYQCAVKMFAKIKEESTKPIAEGGHERIAIDVFFSGFGQGREAVTRAILSADGEEVRRLIARVTDRTPIKIGGVRPKKQRTL